MKLLLDSHILIWALNDDPQLSKKARDYILNPDNLVYYSAASVWELAIKHALRPDNVEFTPQELCDCCDDAGYEPLDVSREHIFQIDSLRRPEDAPAHKDPFDRLLIAQAKEEHMLFLTHDSLLPYYDEACIVPV